VDGAVQDHHHLRKRAALRQRKLLAVNIFSNWVGYAIQAAIAFFLTPYVLHTLGDARYGVWILMLGLTGYYGLLDLGFRAGLTQYLTRHLAVRDFRKLNETASTGLVALACCSLLLLILTGVVAVFAERIFHLSTEIAAEMRLCVVIIGVSAALQFLFFPFSALLVATQRFDLANAIGTSTRIVSAALVVWILKLGYGLVGLSLIVSGANLLDYVLRCWAAYRIVPELSLSPRAATLRSCLEFMRFGVWNVLIIGSVRLISYTDALVIGFFMPPAAIGIFGLAANLRNYYDEFFAPVGHVFFPAATHLDAKGDTDGLRRMYIVGSRLMLLMGVLSGAVAWVFADDFFALWVGSRYTEAGDYPSVGLLFRLLLTGSLCAVGQRIGYQILLATERLQTLAKLFVMEGVLNLGLSVALAPRIGLIGVAVGTMIPAILFQGIIYPCVLCPLLRIRARQYATGVLLKPLLLGAIYSYLLTVLRAIHPGTSWANLVIDGGIATALGLLFAILALERDERRVWIIGPLCRAVEFCQRTNGALPENEQVVGDAERNSGITNGSVKLPATQVRPQPGRPDGPAA
jgi:O-antigen/teichoic acid export membrane protein